jgi:starch phosphorylase
MAKRSIATLLPRFNSYRMVGEYLNRFYVPASQRGREFVDRNYAQARELAEWKQRVRAAWPYVHLRALDKPNRNVGFGEKVRFSVGAKLDGLRPEDIEVELILAPTMKELASQQPAKSYLFSVQGDRDANGEHRFTLDLAPELCGKLEYRIRAYPHHKALSHRFEMGLMKWI